MRTSAHRLTRAAVAAATAVSLAAGALHPAAADEPAPAAGKPPAKGSLSSDVTVKVNKKDSDGTVTVEEKKLPGVTQASSKIGSAELQNWYNSSPEWAQYILGALFVALALDLIGTLVGPVRSAIFNLIRDSHLPIPVPPRP